MCKMAETENTGAVENCEIKLECTENSHRFETRILMIAPGNEKHIGRYRKKKLNTTLDDHLLFDNRILSHTHALLLFQEGKLYLKDLCSSNGTYLNGEYIGPASEEASEPQARQLKTGDVLRFGKLRTIDGELIKPIEAKLTIQYLPSVQVEGSKQPSANYTPCEGQQLEQTALVEQRPGKRSAPSSTISKAIKGKGKPISCKTAERSTVTEEIQLCTKSTQSVHTEEKKPSTACGSCELLTQEFYNYRKRALIAIAFCLAIIVGYQQYVKF
uniref:FHA domain-containing protein n=1 Tax=Anopheles quadriannulatus TaxID=34691 RepID=A0A182XQI4_ANOQN